MDVNFLQQHIDFFKFTFPNLLFKDLGYLNSGSLAFSRNALMEKEEDSLVDAGIKG